VHGDEPVVEADQEDYPEEREANAYGEYDSSAMGSDTDSDDSFFA